MAGARRASNQGVAALFSKGFSIAVFLGIQIGMHAVSEHNLIEGAMWVRWAS